MSGYKNAFWLWCGAGLLPLAATAQGLVAPLPAVSAGVDVSNDSDGFRVFKPWTQYEAASGWGLRAGWQRYSMDDWSATGRSLLLTHRRDTAQYNWMAQLGANTTAGHTQAVGSLDAMHRLGDTTSLGVSLERNVVDSRRGIDAGLNYNAAMLVLDQQLHPRLSLGVAAGSTWFSNDNRRDILRTRWTFTLDEDRGWYAYVKTRNYRNSDPYRPEYFSPARLHDASLGLLWRTALTDKVVISAHVDSGRQVIDGEGQAAWSAGLYLSSPRRAAVQWKVGLESSQDHASALQASAGGYRYTSAVAQVRLPF
ncbi:hypothetical protein N0K08_13270 [Acidovorax sp. Be4]|uniref:Uncharacterized protein n=1 Tax=Acidovorax bellezanensis TaxID=2976702 RepID=A0ABT2PMA0_9BURK|nr:hypothetical protein [Acidovorax sp. Be4]MCT9811614.1 hypothetical protein [Acidovorax sp. Be4]